MMDHSANTGIAKVRAALQRGDSLTHMDALRRFGLWSLDPMASHPNEVRDA